MVGELDGWKRAFTKVHKRPLVQIVALRHHADKLHAYVHSSMDVRNRLASDMSENLTQFIPNEF